MKKHYFLTAPVAFLVFCMISGTGIAMSNASLTGEYVFVGYYGDVGSPGGDETYVLEMEFDGSGGLVSGGAGSEETGTGSYSVAGNGVLTATIVDSDTESTVLEGVVSADGTVVHMVDMDSSVDDDVNLLSGVRISDADSDKEYSHKFFFPHIASNEKWWTGIAAYNPSSSDANLTVTPYTKGGQALDTLILDVEAGGKYLGDATGLSLPEATAWLRIESSRPLNGFELFGSSSSGAAKWLAGYCVVNISRRQGVFAKLEKQGWTGIALVNTSGASAEVTLRIYDDAGVRIAEHTIALAGHEKVLDAPEDLFAGSITAGTYMTFSADREVVGFQLNASEDAMMLDGLPGM